MITRKPLERRVAVGPLHLMVYEWPGAEPAVFFTHANSFHARCWDQVVAHLPGQRCLAVDLRGHGQSDKPAPPYRWRTFAEDLVALGEALALQGAVGVGHSVGGHATALAAALHPALFTALLLVDPVIFPAHVYGQVLEGEHFAARRRNEWPSPEAMFERFRHRPPFNRWKTEVLHDYCQYGLLPAPDGTGYILACPPPIEAAIYAGATTESIYAELATIQVPTVILRGHPHVLNAATDLSASPTAPDLVRHFAHGRDVALLNHSHFIPMETPTLVAGYIRDLLSGLTGTASALG